MRQKLFRLLLIKEDERHIVTYFFLFFILVGAGMALSRGVKNALFLKRYGIEYIPLMYMLLSVMLSITTTAYAAYVDRISPERFFRILFGVLAALIGSSWLLMSLSNVELVYPAYYLIHEVSVEILVIHGALYLAHNLDSSQAKRLTPVVMVGVAIGNIIGGIVLAVSARYILLHDILLGWIVLLLLSMAIVSWWHAQHGVSRFFRPGRKGGNQWRRGLEQISQGIRLVRKYELIRWSYIALFFMGIALTVLWYSVNLVYTNTFVTEEELGSFFGMLTAANSTVALILQMFITNRVIRKFGLKYVNLLFPFTTLLGFGWLLISYSLWSAVFGTFNKDVVMIAFRNPVRNLFFNALPGRILGRARAMSIAMVMPLALLCSGCLIWYMQTGDKPVALLIIGLMCSVLYVYANFGMNKAYVKTIVAQLRKRLLLPTDDTFGILKGSGADVFKEIVRGVRHKDTDISICFAKTLVESYPDRASSVIVKQLPQVDDASRDQLIQLISPLDPLVLRNYLKKELEKGDAHLRATALKNLFDLQDADAKQLIDECLENANPRLRATGIYGVIRCSRSDLYETASGYWRAMLTGSNVGASLAALDLFKAQVAESDYTAVLGSDFKVEVAQLLSNPAVRIQNSVLSVLSKWTALDASGLEQDLAGLIESPDARIRAKVVQCYRFLPQEVRRSLLSDALEDKHPDVRATAIELLNDRSASAIATIAQWITTENRGSPRAQSAMISTLQKTGVSGALMEQIAIAKINDANDIGQAANMLSVDGRLTSSAQRVTAYVLRERYQQIIDLVLMAMTSLENVENIGLVRTALNSQDPRDCAHALDVIENFKHKRLAAQLRDLVDNIQPHADSERQSHVFPLGYKSVFSWCAQRSDPWLRYCATCSIESDAALR